jgi:hypothetical protein
MTRAFIFIKVLNRVEKPNAGGGQPITRGHFFALGVFLKYSSTVL